MEEKVGQLSQRVARTRSRIFSQIERFWRGGLRTVKGIKLDFKSTSSVEDVVRVLLDLNVASYVPMLMLNADLLGVSEGWERGDRAGWVGGWWGLINYIATTTLSPSVWVHAVHGM